MKLAVFQLNTMDDITHPSTRRFVALMTFGISHLTRGSEVLTPFYPYVPRVVQAARAAPGFSSVQPDLGRLQHPRFYDEACRAADLEVSQVLFLWNDLESVMAFSYAGIHKKALEVNREHKWFSHDKWPAYVVWWGNPGGVIWRIGCERLEQLHDQGPTPTAFNFSCLFGPNGAPYRLDSARLRSYKMWYESQDQ